MLESPRNLPSGEELDRLIDGLEKKNFSFGIAHALRQDEIAIFPHPETNAYSISTTPSRVRDSAWHGDCGADSALTYNSLVQMVGNQGVAVERLEIPIFETTTPHYRAVLKEPYRPIDHSIFYSQLEVDPKSISPVEIPEEKPYGVQFEFDLRTPIGFSEFEFDNKAYALNLAIRQPSEKPPSAITDQSRNAIIVVEAYEASKGKITAGYTLSLAVEVWSDDNIAQHQRGIKTAVMDLMKVTIKDNNGIRKADFPHSMLKEEMAQVFEQAIGGLIRGTDIESMVQPILEQKARMEADPAGWFL